MLEISGDPQVGDDDGAVVGDREKGEVVGRVEVVEDMVVIEEFETAVGPQATEQVDPPSKY